MISLQFPIAPARTLLLIFLIHCGIWWYDCSEPHTLKPPDLIRFPENFHFPGKSKNSSRYRRFLLLSYPSPSLFALQFLGFAFAPFCFPRTESWFAPGTVFLCITLYVSFVSYVEKEMMIFYHFGVSMSAYGWDVGFYFLAVS